MPQNIYVIDTIGVTTVQKCETHGVPWDTRDPYLRKTWYLSQGRAHSEATRAQRWASRVTQYRVGHQKADARDSGETFGRTAAT
ncbi:hypothetical protein EVAR_36596_1 [Eumeta japonica]|uniref:Uncharacterized protein n=1 Tax=Eumeta variegata TaxID=151549 RepID=A0A4C1XM36_EUMVA|nr:hypothetical protein EVAR_36596_1 [Eumeta japonica]